MEKTSSPKAKKQEDTTEENENMENAVNNFMKLP